MTVIIRLESQNLINMSYYIIISVGHFGLIYSKHTQIKSDEKET